MSPSADANPSPAAAYDCVAVVGAGAWGTALAMVAAGNASKVLLWARESEVVESIRTARENRLFLPGVRIPETIEATGDASRIGEAQAVLVVTPAQHVRTTCAARRAVAERPATAASAAFTPNFVAATTR